MSISLRQFRYILAVAHLGSFSKAAEELHVSQPALSRSIAAVEERFSVRIFERTRNAVRATAVGAALIAHAERLVLQARALEHNLSLWSSGKGGSIAFGMGPSVASILMPPLLSLLATRYPSLRINARTDSAQALRAELERDEIEFLVCDRSLLPHGSAFEVKRMGIIRMGLFVRAEHPLAGRRAVGPEDVESFPLARGTIPPGFEETIDIALLRKDATIVCDNYHILREVMLSSDTIWLSAPRLLEAELASSRVVELLSEQFGAFTSNVDMISMVERDLSPAARLVRDHMERLLNDAPPKALPTIAA